MRFISGLIVGAVLTSVLAWLFYRLYLKSVVTLMVGAMPLAISRMFRAILPALPPSITGGKIKYDLHEKLQHSKIGFAGEVDAVFSNLRSAIDSGIVDERWLSDQEFPPSSVLCPFYSLVSELGAILIAEDDAIRQIEFL